MSPPLNKRDYDLFLSYAHVDRAFVAALYDWLTEKAGFKVWYDKRELSAGARLATDLQKAIERCRGVLLVATDEALSRGWVKAEYNAAMDEYANHEGFRVVLLRVGNSEMKDVMRGVTWIDVPEQTLDFETATSVLRAFYPGERRPNPGTSRDVYVSCSWQQDDAASARAVSTTLIEQGLRLIGDEKDQRGFGAGDRVESIISSCGAFVSVVPYRDTAMANASDKPYKYFMREIDFAASLGLPSVVIADPRVQRADGESTSWLRMETNAENCSADVVRALSALWEEWIAPPKPHYVFCALDLESDAARANSAIRDLIERVTGMCTFVGTDIHEEPLQRAIMQKLRNAFLVLADITDDNLNTCIEAGIATAAGTNVELLATGETRRPPFMLRTLQMSFHRDPVEQLGIIHKIVRPYRRRVINAEL